METDRPSDKILIEIKDMRKIYNPGENEVHALDGVDLTICEREFVAIIGHSGSGKSTLMNMLGCLDVPTTGTYQLHGIDVSDMDDDELSDVRNREIGFIFQGFNLIQNLTAVENVTLPLIYRGVGKKEREQLALNALEKVGLAHRLDHKPAQMSGGQQQRVAIARALALQPDILCFDEPTSALDPELTGEVLKVIRGLAKQRTTMIIVTHEMAFARDVADRIIFMDEGVIVEQGDPRQVIDHPREERTKQFLTKY